MKSNFKILVLLTASFMSSAFADTASQCGQSNASFVELVREYQACNSITAPDSVSCNRFCVEAKGIGSSGVTLPELRVQAIERCNDKAVSIKNCTVLGEKIVGSSARPPAFEGRSTFNKNDNRSTEQDCRKTSEADATSQALKSCQDATGSKCSVDSSKTIVTHRIQSPFGPRLGRRDDRICDAKVVVEAARDLGYKCSAKISVRNQAFADN